MAVVVSKPKTVLVVNDEEGMRDTLTDILKRDHTVLTAAHWWEGWAVLKRDDVDLMLLDIRLPGHQRARTPEHRA